MISLGVDFRYISEMERLDNVLSSFIVDWDSQVPIEVVDTRATVDLTQWGFPVTIGLHVNNLFQYNYIQLPGNSDPFGILLLAWKENYEATRRSTVRIHPLSGLPIRKMLLLSLKSHRKNAASHLR